MSFYYGKKIQIEEAFLVIKSFVIIVFQKFWNFKFVIIVPKELFQESISHSKLFNNSSTIFQIL